MHLRSMKSNIDQEFGDFIYDLMSKVKSETPKTPP